MKEKTQVLLIHGGMTFKKRQDYLHFLKTRKISLEKKISWTGDYLDKKLGADFETTRPENIHISPDSLKDVVVDTGQAIYISSLLGLKIED